MKFDTISCISLTSDDRGNTGLKVNEPGRTGEGGEVYTGVGLIKNMCRCNV